MSGNVGSSAAHDYYPSGNVYCATKHAVKAISKSLRLDLVGAAIHASEINPDLTHAEFSEARWKDKKRSDQFYGRFTTITR